jgi:hypothetical protein
MMEWTISFYIEREPLMHDLNYKSQAKHTAKRQVVQKRDQTFRAWSLFQNHEISRQVRCEG